MKSLRWFVIGVLLCITFSNIMSYHAAQHHFFTPDQLDAMVEASKHDAQQHGLWHNRVWGLC